ncbi:MAG: hypothetical protein NTU57_02720 [Candidatus Aenigmarchaeota archaeon]|nr:hypothetical protein [Candidatus Aenigmarchaeota archaeon]
MSFNQVENAFLGAAIDSLRKQNSHVKAYKGFGLGKMSLMVLRGDDGWDYLAPAIANDSRPCAPHPDFEPVKCYPPTPQSPTETTYDHFLRHEHEVGEPANGVNLKNIRL